MVAEPGARLGPAQVGALAAAGIAEVACSKTPRVAVLATGSELRGAGETLAPGQIFESNRAMVAAALERAGAEVEVLPVVADDVGAHREAIARGLEADVLVTSGGVSMGEHDLVRRVEAELGVQEIFWGVAVKPGKPISFGVRERTLVFGLPGNPVSSLVGALVFVSTGLRAAQGEADPLPRYGCPDTSCPSPQRSARRVPAGCSRSRRGRSGARRDRRPGVAHDRSRGRGGRPRSRPARGRSDRGGSLVRFIALDSAKTGSSWGFRSRERATDLKRGRTAAAVAPITSSLYRMRASDRRTGPAGGASTPPAYGA